MATPSSPALKRSQATRGFHNAGHISPRRGRRGSAVTFDAITSIYPLDEAGDSHHLGTLASEVEEEDEQSGSNRCYTCNTLLERRSVRWFFSLCAVLNLLSLVFSAPLRMCEPEGIANCTQWGNGTSTESGGDCTGVFAQFVVIAIVDFVLAIFYTIQLVLRLQYAVFLCLTGHKKVLGVFPPCMPSYLFPTPGLSRQRVHRPG